MHQSVRRRRAGALHAPSACYSQAMFDASDDIAKLTISPTAFAKLMESVGLLLFHWSRLEEALVEDIRRLRAEGGGSQTSIVRVRGSFSERLAEWRALLSLKSRRNPTLAEAVLAVANRLERLRQKRNLVAHQFAGAAIDYGETFVICAAVGGGTSGDFTRLSQTELSTIIGEMVECADEVRRLKTLQT